MSAPRGTEEWRPDAKSARQIVQRVGQLERGTKSADRTILERTSGQASSNQFPSLTWHNRLGINYGVEGTARNRFWHISPGSGGDIRLPDAESRSRRAYKYQRRGRACATPSTHTRYPWVDQGLCGVQIFTGIFRRSLILALADALVLILRGPALCNPKVASLRDDYRRFPLPLYWKYAACTVSAARVCGFHSRGIPRSRGRGF